MRALFIDSRDSARRGPWSRQRWDLVVDMGKSSAWSAEEWAEQYGCSVVRTDAYREKVDDVRRVREMLRAGLGRLIDEQGIDWWDITYLLLVPDALELVAMRRVASTIPPSAELWVTRRSPVARVLEILLGRELRIFGDSRIARTVARASHYAGVLGQFSGAQVKEIFFDKYDPGYRWRGLVAGRSPIARQPVVLVPTAYGNVSRMAAAYARLLPEQRFLMVATRSNAKELLPPENMQVRDLAEYAGSRTSSSELSSLLDRWSAWKRELESMSDLDVLARAGVLESIPDWIRDGLSVRNAWQEVFRREPVRAVLCGDDSNRYTRLPVLLAAKEGIPTVDFHHGAFDGHYLLKTLPCDVYMVKDEMERDYQLRLCGLPHDKVVVAAPAPQSIRSTSGSQSRGNSIVVFSEPYDVLGARSEEVYRELLLPLCGLARAHGRNVIVKLHPFESKAERDRLFRKLLAPSDYKLVQIVDGPLTDELMANAWFGVTFGSTTALDCLQHGVACFLCGWLTLSPYEYPEQFARFGVAEVLGSAEEVSEIPRRVEEFRNRPPNRAALWAPADPALLEQWLSRGRTERQERPDARVVS